MSQQMEIALSNSDCNALLDSPDLDGLVDADSINYSAEGAHQKQYGLLE